jgi:hypothetical protein
MVGTVFPGENYDLGDIWRASAGLEALGYTFTIYTRFLEVAPPNTSSVTIVRDAGVEDLCAAVRQASFVLIFPSGNPGSWYLRDRITGALPLSITAGTPILTRTRLSSIYGLGEDISGTISAEAVEDILTRVRDTTPASYAALVEAASRHRERVVAHNVATIEDVLLQVPSIHEREGAALAAAKVEEGEEEGGGGHKEQQQHPAGPRLPLSPLFSTRIPP